jgi:hypothetical protein
MKSVFAIFMLLVCTSSHAALISVLAGQAVYDTDLDITWVADANLVLSNSFGLPFSTNLGSHPSDSSIYDGFIQTFGGMTWPGALFFIDAMNAANYLGFDDWRLPATLHPDASCTPAVVPPTSTGFDCAGSEMGHLFYSEFGATANTSVDTTGNPAELAKFSNVLNASTGNLYWSSLELDPNFAWWFRFDNGSQGAASKNTPIGVWAVRDGNVVPLPAAFWLFCSALGLLGWMRRKAA